ncbi:MAG TPA: tetratricopeptide repeat protein, partial [Chloroflexota bacterium]|nr:tetratricopeptide repeat protein [Chloroflexota bacterium]
TLSVLLDKSLVRQLRNGRYDIHELLRQYAAGRLTAETTQAAAARLAAYYLSLVETAADHLIGPEQYSWLGTLELEYDNLLVALRWAIDSGDGDTAVRLGAGLGRYWWLRYRPVEGGNWLRRILALPGLQTASYSRALVYAGMLARLRRDYAEAESWLTESVRNMRPADNKRDLGRSLNELGMLYLDQGNFDRAQPLFAECLVLARELASPHVISIALLNLGMVTQYQNNLAVAERYYTEGLTLSRQLNLKTNVAMILNSYSALLLDQNRLEPAREMLL